MAHILTPQETVQELDRYIIGQGDAKRAVAIALRNRYRRSRLAPELQEEITPKNIIMMGPTGVGKTEIARRLARLVNAPFVKVEATKFTEVGYVGRDVESIIRDLVEVAIRLVKAERQQAVQSRAQLQADERLAHVLADDGKTPPTNPFEQLFGGGQKTPPPTDEQTQQLTVRRQDVHSQLVSGALDQRMIEIEVADEPPAMELVPGSGNSVSLGDMFGNILPKRTKRRRVSVAEARRIFTEEEAAKLIDMDEVQQEALRRTEQDGIVFLDEIDKIAGGSHGSGPDVSREGVQRDILPIVEGSTITTKYGPVKTDFILFIAAGAFHLSKIDDLIPELQGRFPIHVTLQSLTEENFCQILTQPDNAITKQYVALLQTDGVEITFTDDAIKAIAHYAFENNETGENIGARRLHAIMETLLEDIAFNAGSGDQPAVGVTVDGSYVHARLKNDVDGLDLTRFIL